MKKYVKANTQDYSKEEKNYFQNLRHSLHDLIDGLYDFEMYCTNDEKTFGNVEKCIEHLNDCVNLFARIEYDIDHEGILNRYLGIED